MLCYFLEIIQNNNQTNIYIQIENVVVENLLALQDRKLYWFVDFIGYLIEYRISRWFYFNNKN